MNGHENGASPSRLLAGLVAAVWLIWAIGFGAVIAAIARAGFGGLALLCLYALVVFVVLAAAWIFLLPQDQRRGAKDFYLARLVRDSIAEISPFSPVGGMVGGRPADDPAWHERGLMPRPRSRPTPPPRRWRRWRSWPSASRLGVAHFRHLASAGPLTEAMVATLLLAVPGIAALILLQKKGADFAERIAARFFPRGQKRRQLPRRHP